MSSRSFRKSFGGYAGYPPGQSPDKDREAAYESFAAKELYCPHCKTAMPVRERMLLVLPRGELFEYVCVKCSTSLGTRTT